MRIPFKKILILILLIMLFFLYYHLFSKPVEEDTVGRIINVTINIIWGITILTIIFVLIMENRSPSKTLSWILILFFLPVIGFILYLVFGRNFRKKHIYARKEHNDYEKLQKMDSVHLEQESPVENHSKDSLSPSGIIRNEEKPIISLISKLLENNNKAFLTHRNRIEIYSDGEQAFQALLAAVKEARESIHLQFFVFKGDGTGRILGDTLIKKAKEGIEVRLLYDAVGSWNIGKRFVKSLQEHGVRAACFSPVDFPFISSKMNYRNHRKIAVIDGKFGFLGGVNIADRYRHKDSYYGFWRDTHLKIEGEAVHSLQALFVNDWTFSTKESLMLAAKYFPAHQITEINPLQVISSGPDSDWESIMQGYFAMITLAVESINIVTPYLVLNESMLTAVKVSALSGVTVRLIMPSKPDHHLVYWASRSYYQELMEAGVKIYEYQKGFIHSKFITVDGLLSSIGSANMDIRSFTQNLEINAFLFSEEITAQLNEIFEEDLQNSKEITPDFYSKRSYTVRIKESFTRLFSPVL